MKKSTTRKPPVQAKSAPAGQGTKKTTPGKSASKPAAAPKSAPSARPVKPTAARPRLTPETPAAPKSRLNGAKPSSTKATNGKASGSKPVTAEPKPVVKTPPATLLPKPKSSKVDPGKLVAPPRPEPIIAPEKDLSAKHKQNVTKDRLVMMVPDPFWLHVIWELSLQSVHRAEAALGQDWHGAKPILRLLDVTASDTTSTSEATIRDIPIHGGCNHWYIDVPQPPRSYRCDIGYLSKRGQFYVMARSNVVTPPKSGASELLEDNWAADIDSPATAERILAMSSGFEQTGSTNSQLKDLLDETFRKPIKEGQFGAGAMPGKMKKFFFDINAELIVFGQTDSTASVRLQNEPVKLRSDGSFTMRFSLPDSRQIIPCVATSADGLEEQTIVLAVERNIKRLDPMVHDLYGEA